MSSYWSDGYRQDCSGYVSMAWKLPGNEWTGSLAQYAEKITKAELQPGDILLFHNASDPYNGSHVVIGAFGEVVVPEADYAKDRGEILLQRSRAKVLIHRVPAGE